MKPSDIEWRIKREKRAFLMRVLREHPEFFGLLREVTRIYLFNEYELEGPRKPHHELPGYSPHGTTYTAINEHAAFSRLLWAWYLFVSSGADAPPSDDQNAATRTLVVKALSDPAVVRELPSRVVAILALRYLPEQSRPTYEELGKPYGISRERVRQLVKEALGTIRRLMKD